MAKRSLGPRVTLPVRECLEHDEHSGGDHEPGDGLIEARVASPSPAGQRRPLVLLPARAPGLADEGHAASQLLAPVAVHELEADLGVLVGGLRERMLVWVVKHAPKE